MIGNIIRDQRGVSAVEFALLSPILTLGALATFDAGSAVYEKMVINQSLRTAAQSAIESGDIDQARDVLLSTAEENFTVVSGNSGTDSSLAVTVIEYCICPSAPTVVVGCGTGCAGGGAVQRAFAITADKTYDGILLPPIALSGEIDVLIP